MLTAVLMHQCFMDECILQVLEGKLNIGAEHESDAAVTVALTLPLAISEHSQISGQILTAARAL